MTVEQLIFINLFLVLVIFLMYLRLREALKEEKELREDWNQERDLSRRLYSSKDDLMKERDEIREKAYKDSFIEFYIEYDVYVNNVEYKTRHYPDTEKINFGLGYNPQKHYPSSDFPSQTSRTFKYREFVQEFEKNSFKMFKEQLFKDMEFWNHNGKFSAVKIGPNETVLITGGKLVYK
jgi:hypothetical protein